MRHFILHCHFEFPHKLSLKFEIDRSIVGITVVVTVKIHTTHDVCGQQSILSLLYLTHSLCLTGCCMCLLCFKFSPGDLVRLQYTTG